MSAQEGLVEFLEAVSRSFNIRAAAANEDNDYQSYTANARTCLKVRDALVAKDARITSLESELAEARASRHFQKKKKDEARAGRDENAQGLQHWKAEANRLLADNARVREHSEHVLSFLDELANNAKPDQRRPLNSIIIGGSAKLIAEAFRAALAGHEQAGAKKLSAEDQERIWKALINSSEHKYDITRTITAEQMREADTKPCWCLVYEMPEGFPHRPSCPDSPGKGGE